MAYSATVTVIIFAMAMFMSSAIRDRNQEIISGELRKYAPFAGEAFKGAFSDGIDKADLVAKELGNKTSARVTLISVDGIVLGDSEKNPALMENHAGRPEIKVALSGEIGESTRYSTTIEERMTYVAVPVIENGMVKGVVRVSLKTQAVELLATMATKRIALFAIVFWGIALILTFLFSTIFSASVRQLVDLTKRLARGDFTKRAEVKHMDEMGELASGLNDMARQLQSLFIKLQTQHDELNAIIESMTEGVLVLDRQLRVRYANSSLKKMFDIKGDLEDRGYMEVTRSTAIKEMVEELPEHGQVEHKRMELDDNKIIMANGVALVGADRDEGSHVLVFHDITFDAQMENIKAEFAANASHELRTPLTAIKGYLETFDEEDRETQKSFIQVIRRNVERISNLVSDLLLLSRLESPVPQTEMEKVILANIAEDVVKLISRMAKEKDTQLKVDIKPEIAINGDPFLLEQMLLNLLDNAVKYTEHGEVILRARQIPQEAIIQVIDTGIGIPREHIPRIFERFYRVDKARSRQLGGTGLGLSIVKHIIQLHNGKIEVESQPGIKTIFTIKIPVLPQS